MTTAAAGPAAAANDTGRALLPDWVEPRTIPALFDRRAAEHPDRLAIIAPSAVLPGGEARLTYAELADLSRRAAAGLHATGVRARERVGLLASNGAARECVLAMLGILRVGAVMVPLNTRFTAEELRYGLDHSECRWLIAERDLLPTVDAILPELPRLAGVAAIGAAPGAKHTAWQAVEAAAPLPAGALPEPDENTVAHILYTSGTTARPKGVVMTHGNAVATGISFADGLGLTGDDIHQCGIPFFTSSGCQFNPMAVAWAGCTYVIEPRIDAEETLRRIGAERTTIYLGVPSALIFLLDAYDPSRHDVSSLRMLDYGGAPMPPEVIRRLRARFPHCDLRQNYGLTESGPTGTIMRGDDLDGRMGSVGKPMPLCEIKVVDEAMRTLAPGAVGEIAIRSPAVMQGYLKDPEATAKALKDGFVLTGDLGYLDADGFLFHVDRRKDIIIRGGTNISSMEVEEALTRHPAVQETAVVAVAHAKLGEDLQAFVVLRPGAAVAAEELRAFARQSLSDFKTPRRIAFVAALPRNPMGKVLKTELRRRAAELRPPSTSNARTGENG